MFEREWRDELEEWCNENECVAWNPEREIYEIIPMFPDETESDAE